MQGDQDQVNAPVHLHYLPSAYRQTSLARAYSGEVEQWCRRSGHVNV